MRKSINTDQVKSRESRSRQETGQDEGGLGRMERVGQEQGAEQGAGGIGQQERSYSRSGAEVLSRNQGNGTTRELCQRQGN
jgi:hypothetical protein